MLWSDCWEIAGVRYSAAIQEIAWIEARDKLHNSGISFLLWSQQALLQVTGECRHLDQEKQAPAVVDRLFQMQDTFCVESCPASRHLRERL